LNFNTKFILPKGAKPELLQRFLNNNAVVNPDLKRLFPEPSDVIMFRGKTPLKKFVIKDKLNPKCEGYRCVILGASGSGKSNLVCSAMYELRELIPVWIVINASEAASQKYTPFLPSPTCVWEPEQIGKQRPTQQIIDCLTRMKSRAIKKAREWRIPETNPVKYKHSIAQAIIADDISEDRKIFNDPIWGWVAKVSRNYFVLIWLILQNDTDFPLHLRKNISHLFIFQQDSPRDIKKLFTNYFGIFGNGKEGEALFREAYRLCTTPSKIDEEDPRFRCMVYDFGCKSSKIEDRVSWIECAGSWKLPDFKVGSKAFKKIVEDSFDPDWLPRWEKTKEEMEREQNLTKAEKRKLELQRQKQRGEFREDTDPSNFYIDGEPEIFFDSSQFTDADMDVQTPFPDQEDNNNF
jgi:hypothetical protein